MSSMTSRQSRIPSLFVCLVVIAMSVSAIGGLPARAYGTAVRLLGTTIGVGPSFDGFGLSVPLLFNGTAIAAGQAFHTVPYPAQINLDYPFISDLPGLSDLPYWPHSLKQSERIGAGYLEADLERQRVNAPAGAKVTILGYSQGTQVAEIARADMAKNPDYVAHADDYNFVLLGDPYQPNGGILARFTSWSGMPVLGDLFPFGRPGPSDSPFRTTYYQNQYDGFADFPAYFNLLAVTNAAMGIIFQHVFPGYVLDDPDAPNVVSSTVGKTTYVTIPHLLPLLAPLRLAASLIGAQRFVDALDPILRVFVEAGYDRTADPSQVKEFGWKTPQEKTDAAFKALPGAFAQSLAILCGASYTPTVPTPVVSAEQPETPVTDHPARPVDDTPGAQAVRNTVVGVSDVLSVVTRTVAALLQVVSGHAPAQSGPDPVADTAKIDAPPSATAETVGPVASSPQESSRVHAVTETPVQDAAAPPAARDLAATPAVRDLAAPIQASRRGAATPDPAPVPSAGETAAPSAGETAAPSAGETAEPSGGREAGSAADSTESDAEAPVSRPSTGPKPHPGAIADQLEQQSSHAPQDSTESDAADRAATDASDAAAPAAAA